MRLLAGDQLWTVQTSERHFGSVAANVSCDTHGVLTSDTWYSNIAIKTNAFFFKYIYTFFFYMSGMLKICFLERFDRGL